MNSISGTYNLKSIYPAQAGNTYVILAHRFNHDSAPEIILRKNKTPDILDERALEDLAMELSDLVIRAGLDPSELNYSKLPGSTPNLIPPLTDLTNDKFAKVVKYMMSRS